MTIGEPRVGQVIRYSFLWRKGPEKDRPAVIIAAVRKEIDGRYTVSVMPITRTPPIDPATALEIPRHLKRHLGLDDQKSWVVLNEINRFLWPGHDLRPVPHSKGRWEYGQLPRSFFRQIKTQLGLLMQTRKISITERE